MDFARDDFAKDDFAKDVAATPDDKASPASKSAGLEGSAAQIVAAAESGGAADANKPGASQRSTDSPMTGEVIGPGMDQEAGPSARGAKTSAVVRGPQGSALVRIPPVMRNAEEPQGSAYFSAKGAGFRGERVSRPMRSAFLPEGWVRYAGPVALGFCLFGVGIATGGQFFHGAAPTTLAAQPAVAGAVKLANADQVAMLRLSKKLADEIHVLQSRVDALQVAVRSQTPEDLSGVKNGLDGLRAKFESATAQSNVSMAQITARLDRLQRQEAMLEKPPEKLHHAEKSVGGPIMTGSIAAPAAAHGTVVAAASAMPALPKGEARLLGPATQAKKRPHLLADWVVRDVYQGIALVEGPNGAIEVARGEVIPGAGRVEAIERKNGGWIVVTNRGVVGSLRD